MKKIQLNGHDLYFTETFKCLGHLVCETLSDDGNKRKEWKKVKAIGNDLRSKCGSCSKYVKRT